MKKVKAWFEENKMELMFAWASLATIVCIILGILVLLTVSMTNELTTIANDQKKEIANLTHERNYYYYISDELKQTYEETVPLGQYVQDIEYLESVILELRTQCETYNNKEN